MRIFKNNIFPKIHQELMRNIKNNMHRSINKITIDFIKTAVGLRGVSAKFSEVSNSI